MCVNWLLMCAWTMRVYVRICVTVRQEGGDIRE